MTERIAWQTWTAGGYSARASKSHYIREDEEGQETSVTLCGTCIPESGGGIEVGNGDDYGDGECKRCTTILEKEETQ